MTRQLSLDRSQQRQAPLDPWTEEQRRRPGVPLLRVIDLNSNSQAFLDVRTLRGTDLPDGQVIARWHGHGMTAIYRPTGLPALPMEEEAAIIREWDDVWRAQQ